MIKTIWIIGNSIQGHFGDTPLEKRQELLREMYNFSCTCEACTNNYPLAKDLPKTYAETQSSSKNIDELKELDSKNLKLGEKIFDALEENDLCQIEELYCQRLQLACQHLPNPHMIILSNRLKQSYFHNLEQSCTTYGPRAKCGPLKL